MFEINSLKNFQNEHMPTQIPPLKFTAAIGCHKMFMDGPNFVAEINRSIKLKAEYLETSPFR
ncbi:MAG: hypothetical protein DHS20C05_08080 [Hyphococcus sp.]|nr:MAG: hypothetical protein DHS20C05_08080 [Marinicaulis sp.]